MKIYLVETGTWDESYIIYISTDINKVEEAFKKNVAKNNEISYMRWTSILEAETDVEYAGMGFGSYFTKEKHMKQIKKATNVKEEE